MLKAGSSRLAGQKSPKFLLSCKQAVQGSTRRLSFDIALNGGEFVFPAAAAHHAEAALGFFPGGSAAGVEKNIEEDAAIGRVESFGERGGVKRCAGRNCREQRLENLFGLEALVKSSLDHVLRELSAEGFGFDEHLPQAALCLIDRRRDELRFRLHFSATLVGRAPERFAQYRFFHTQLAGDPRGPFRSHQTIWNALDIRHQEV